MVWLCSQPAGIKNSCKKRVRYSKKQQQQQQKRSKEKISIMKVNRFNRASYFFMAFRGENLIEQVGGLS